ncbi:MAG: right-handed parallel beta-helix repeat-containing protein [Candidatus Krumholzibacteriota bacterium]|nr:right-handed parallel beta-helix repeat-containing protein [Candidatus Krumholzibacteriota bacterium]
MDTWSQRGPVRVLIALAIAFTAATASAARIHVPSDYTTVQAAIDAAIPGDTVLAAPGIYTGPGNRDIQLRGMAVSVIGDGGSASEFLDCLGVGRGFCIHEGETTATLIQGLTLLDGYGGSGGTAGGGGVRIYGASPTLRDLQIEDCVSSSWGGGIHAHDGAPIFEDVMITGCGASVNGGGMSILFCTADLRGLVIHDNHASHDGGVIYIEDCTARLEQVAVAQNGCEVWGGGIAIWDEGSVDIVNCIIAYATEGGGILQATYSTLAEVTFTCCDVFDNAGGDYCGYLSNQTGVNGNISAYPLFCDLQDGDLGLHEGSPCLPENNDCGLLMGAYGQGCEHLTGVTEKATPAALRLAANYPNPFNPETAIRFGLPAYAAVDLEIFDVAGRRVATLLAGEALPAGWHVMTWQGREDVGRALASGVYLYRLRADGQARVGKMTLLK